MEEIIELLVGIILHGKYILCILLLLFGIAFIISATPLGIIFGILSILSALFWAYRIFKTH